MFCMNCGTKLPDGAKFCMNCGAKVGSIDAAAPAAPKTRTAAKKENVELQALYTSLLNINYLVVPDTGIYMLGITGRLVMFDPASGERRELVPKSGDGMRCNLCYWEGNVYFLDESLFDVNKLYLYKVEAKSGAVTKTAIRSDGTVQSLYDNNLNIALAQLWNGALWFFNEKEKSVCSISLSTGRLSGKKLPEAAARGCEHVWSIHVHDGYGYTCTNEGGVRFKLSDPGKFQQFDKGALVEAQHTFVRDYMAFYKDKIYHRSWQEDDGESYIFVTPMEKDWVGAARRIEPQCDAHSFIRLGSHLFAPQSRLFDLDMDTDTDTETVTKGVNALREPLEAFLLANGLQEMPDGSAYIFIHNRNNRFDDNDLSNLKVYYLPANAWETGEYKLVLDTEIEKDMEKLF